MSVKHPGSFALAVAAPSLRDADDTPWTSTQDVGLAAVFWLAFHSVSVLLHAIAVTVSVLGPFVLAVVPIPFLAAMCSEVHAVEKPVERVEMAIVELPPPPPPEPLPSAEVVAPTSAVKVAKTKKLLKARSKALDTELVAMLRRDVVMPEGTAVLGALSSSSHADVFGALEGGVEGGVVGGLVGAEIGDAYGVGGLGLRGTGPGGGGTNEGLGTLGTIGGASKAPRLTFDALSSSQRAVLARRLTRCRSSAELHGVLVAQGGRVVEVRVEPKDACVARVLRDETPKVLDGEHPFVVTPAP